MFATRLKAMAAGLFLVAAFASNAQATFNGSTCGWFTQSPSGWSNSTSSFVTISTATRGTLQTCNASGSGDTTAVISVTGSFTVGVSQAIFRLTWLDSSGTTHFGENHYFVAPGYEDCSVTPCSAAPVSHAGFSFTEVISNWDPSMGEVAVQAVAASSGDTVSLTDLDDFNVTWHTAADLNGSTCGWYTQSSGGWSNSTTSFETISTTTRGTLQTCNASGIGGNISAVISVTGSFTAGVTGNLTTTTGVVQAIFRLTWQDSLGVTHFGESHYFVAPGYDNCDFVSGCLLAPASHAGFSFTEVINDWDPGTYTEVAVQAVAAVSGNTVSLTDLDDFNITWYTTG